MSVLNLFVIVLAILFSSSHSLRGQKNDLSVSLGASYNVKRNAAGYGVGFSYARHILPRHSIVLEANHLFQHSRQNLPADFAQKNYLLRTFENPDPFHYNIPNGWYEAFQGWNLKPKPNRFFTSFFSINYQFTLVQAERSQWRISLGSGLHYRDESELLKVEKITYNPKINNIDFYYLPIFRYNTFLDASMIGGINYHRQLKETLFVGLVNRVVYFPKSKQGLLSSNVMITKQF